MNRSMPVGLWYHTLLCQLYATRTIKFGDDDVGPVQSHIAGLAVIVLIWQYNDLEAIEDAETTLSGYDYSSTKCVD